MGIGARIKLRRSELGLSQRDLSNRMGYKNHSTIARIEEDTVDIPHSRIVQFASVLDVTVEYLMGLDDSTDSQSDPELASQNNMLGQKIRQARLSKGLTQEELGRLLGVEKSAVAKYENGRIVNLKHATLLKISEILDISPAELLADNEIKPFDDNQNTPQDNRSNFARNLRFYMAKYEKSRNDMSEALGVSYYTFSTWCTGKKYPRIDKIQALADYFGITKSDLIEGTPTASASKDSERIDTVANRLKYAMEQSEKKQVELSRETGIDKGAICNYLKGKYEPKQDAIYKLAKVLNVSEEWLLGYDCDCHRHNEHLASGQENSEVKKIKAEILDIILRLHTDSDFLETVEMISTLDRDKLGIIQKFLDAFSK